MSARLAQFCLVIATASAAMAQPSAFLDSRLVVYLRSADAQPSGPLRHMKSELEAIMARAGFDVSWRGSGQPVDAPFVAIVDTMGFCAPGPASPVSDATSLASTSMTDGRVLPFSKIDCAALTRALGPVGESLYGRAMARVLAHELYHVMAQTTHHGRSGLAKPCFSTSDLLADRFDFEEKIRVELRSLRDTTVSIDATDDDASTVRRRDIR